MQVVLPKLHRLQQVIADSKARFKLVVAGRRGGKTFLAVWLAMRVALSKENAHIFWVAPIYSQTQPGWELLTAMAGALEGVKIERADRRIVFPNGSWIAAKSADHPDRLRGFSLDFVVLDEGASMKPEVWFEVLRPALIDRMGEALFIGTPKGTVNWFYELWKAAEARIASGKTDWAVFRFATSDNPTLNQEEIASLIENADDEALVAQELRAEFVTRSGKTIKAEWFYHWSWRKIDGEYYREYGEGKLAHIDQCRIEVTVDPAVSKKDSADFFAIATYAVTPTNDVLILDVHQERVLGPDQPKYIEDHMRRWGASKVWVETVAYQLALFQALERRGVNVGKLPADRDKPTRVSYFGLRMKNKQIFWPQYAEWFDDVQLEVTNFPDVAHDDRTDALAYIAYSTKPNLNEPSYVSGGEPISLDVLVRADRDFPVERGHFVREGAGELASVLQTRGAKFAR